MLRVFSNGKPSVRERFGEGSASIAIVLSPLLAKKYARPPAIRVLPTPPLPETAIFIRFHQFSLGFSFLFAFSEVIKVILFADVFEADFKQSFDFLSITGN